MEAMKRTHTCGECSRSHAGQRVVLNGWVHRKRDHGGIHFINLRDRYGLTQIVVDEDAPSEVRELVKSLKFEYCIAVEGTVRERPSEMVNPEMPTGEIEVAAEKLSVLSACDVLPFMIDEKSEAKEDLRLEYRYLDIRSFSMQRKIKLRHDVTYATREYLDSKGFYEIETPTLIKSTPEGARDFLVPARLQPGKFFALPQSPQLFKQILMVSGIDKYFQIPRCYRDEDARGDRQLEFTQIDLEMSFVSRDDVFETVEGLMKHVFDKALGYTVEIPFRRISFADAMNRFGTDKPDLRFGLEIEDLTDIAEASDFKVFKSVAESGGSVKALRVPGRADYSRKQIDELEAAAKIYGAKGLAWMKVTGAEEKEAQKALALDGGIAKFFTNQAGKIIDRLGCEEGDLLLFVADKWNKACIAMGAVRSRLGRDLGLINKRVFEFCWIVDFPLLEWNEEEERWDPAHHMFTMPKEEYIDSLEKDPGAVTGDVYDLVINGNEIASGSIRIHDPKLQSRVFSILGFSEEEAERRFGFLLKAFKYGPPPHGGIAPGLDRLVMLMAGEDTIREVIPFPKNTVGASPMEDSPSSVDPKQLEELHLRIVPPESDNQSFGLTEET